MKRLLVIGYVWPEPNSSAAGSRMLQLLSSFQKAGYTITYASPAEDSSHAVDLAALRIEKSKIELNSASFDTFVSELNPQAVLFDRFMMEEQFGWRVEKHCPDAIRLLDTEDLHFLRHARHQAVKQNREVETKDLHSELAQREIAAILRCDLTFMISEYEMSLLTDHFKVSPDVLCYTPFMMYASEDVETAPFDKRQHFISIGNFRHEPNWDAVRYLKETIWPKIRKQLPRAELHVYGGYPPKKATQLHNEKQGFLVKGWAEDAQTVISSAKVLLAPLRFGAGLKGKLIDAAQYGTPAVTTSIGAEAMYGEQHPAPARVTDDPETFVKHAVELYEKEHAWQPLSDAGPKAILERFNISDHQEQLIKKIKKLEDNLEEHRLNHFYGAMLRHHSLKSSQYMAQWIEAKNKLL